MLALLMTAFAMASGAAASTRTLVTPNYTITITEHCKEYDIVCSGVSYHSVSRSGKSITLRGKQVFAMCKDGTTPCHSLGYSFSNKDVTYFVSDGGELTVTRRKTKLVDEQGKWNDN